MDRPLIVKSDKCKEGLSFDLSHEDVVEQLLPMFEKEVLTIVERGEVEYDYHEWEDDGEPFIDE